MSDDDDRKSRGSDVVRRRLRLDIKSTNKFAEATGIDREALGKVERGVGSRATLERVEAWLDDAEAENRVRIEPEPSPLLRITLHDVKASGGVELGEVIAEGTDSDELADAVAKILDRLRGTTAD